MITIEDFKKVDIRVGKIIEVNNFPEARKPAYKLKIDFGPGVGIKNSSVQIVDLYKKDELLGKLILGVVNLPSRKISTFESEVLTLGVPDIDNRVILIVPDKERAVLGSKLFWSLLTRLTLSGKMSVEYFYEGRLYAITWTWRFDRYSVWEGRTCKKSGWQHEDYHGVLGRDTATCYCSET